MGTSVWAAPLRVGLYENPPKVFTDDYGRPSGSFIELLQEIAKVEGWTLVFERCAWEECLERVEAGALDLMPDVAVTEERVARFDFHRVPAMHSWSQLYRHPSVRVDSLLDLADKRIVVLSQGVQAAALGDLLSSFNVHAQMIEVQSLREAFEKVASGQAEVAAVGHHFGEYTAHEYGLVATPVLFQPARLYFAVPRGRHAAVLRAIDDRLEQWIRDDASVYFQIMNRWGMRATQRPHSRIILIALAGSLFIGSMLATGVWWLRRRVRQAVADLRLSHQQLEATLQAIPDLLFEVDHRGRYLHVHASREELLAAPKGKLLGSTIDDVLPVQAAATVHKTIGAAIDRGRCDGDVIELEVAGGTHWFELSAARKVLQDGGLPNVIILSRDITERVNAQAQFQHLARFDGLTGLPNRAYVRQLLQQATMAAHREGKQVTVLYLDVDHFRTIVDTLGHDVGDRLLTQLSQRLGKSRREADIAGRMGGDEFLLVLPGIDAAGAAVAAQRVLDSMQPSFRVGSHEISISVSLGIVVYPRDGTDVDALLRRADAAMYQAKSEGRNGYRFFTTAMQERSARTLTISNALALALEREQFQVHYQPIVRITNREVIGAEALLRWTHPQLGQVPPSEFITVAESASQIVRIGEWVLRQAAGQARKWLDLGREIVVSVNVSPVQFRQPSFLSTVRAVLEEHTLPPFLLELEVTESLMMGDERAVQKTMHALADMGVRFAIDDFGTGYSSMAYLRRMGFHKLKIDQCFVRDIGTDPDDECIIDAILQLGRNLGMATLAEGVETEEQRVFLAAKGCDYLQGWLVSPALPPSSWDLILGVGRPLP
ncbi:EAL domain-containing protein [Candidatus Symbiobacter mobilis]|nr:EAL domain-containing protein [Candidatus Symbiobacter mobilis]